MGDTNNSAGSSRIWVILGVGCVALGAMLLLQMNLNRPGHTPAPPEPAPEATADSAWSENALPPDTPPVTKIDARGRAPTKSPAARPATPAATSWPQPTPET